MEKKICCIQGRFCWKESPFTSREAVVDFSRPFFLILTAYLLNPPF